MGIFKDRTDAGRRLSMELSAYKNNEDLLVLGLPRGGVPVAYEVARSLNAPLDVFIVRKLGVPGREELAFGAIASGDVLVLNDYIIKTMGISDEVIQGVVEREKNEFKRRETEYRGNRPLQNIFNKTVILVDDGLATGASMRAAIEALKLLNPGKVVIAVPTASIETCAELESIADDIICAATPHPFRGVGYWYENFSQTTDEEVKDLLKKSEEFLDL